MDIRGFDELARKLADAVPPAFTGLQRDLEQNFKAVLQSALGKMEIVTRSEFDVQVEVLKRTREKLEALEQRLAAMESTPRP